MGDAAEELLTHAASIVEKTAAEMEGGIADKEETKQFIETA